MTMFNEEAEQSLDEYVEEATEARREESIIFYEGCTIVTAPTGPPPEYLTVEVDTINDYNVMWRGVPTMPAVGDEVIVWENPLSHRREIWGGSGTSGTSGGGSWCQKVIVAKCGGDFTLLSTAIAWINALAAGPLATRLFAINILGGNFVEINNVTIPPFVHVSGEGEGTEIEMGVFTLIMSANTSLQDVVVESSDPVDAVRISGVANVVLRNVSVIETSTGDCFHILGASTDVYLYNCVANVPAAAVGFHIEESAVAELYDCLVITTGAYNAATYGFELENSCAVIMSGCRAENDIVLAIGLHMSTSTGLFCLTRYCVFSAKDDDILTQTNNLWYHQFCEFDPDNSTIVAGSHTALPTKRFNQTVIVAEAGGDFQALSEAVAWINAQGDAAAGKLYGVLMLMGNFAEGAPVTIPQYVSVMGMGEGTEIEMGANSLILSSDSSLMDVVVEGNPAGGVVQIASGESNVILRNVRSIQSNGAGYCYYADGDAYTIWFYECRAEGSAGADGFVFEEASAVLDDCEANHGNLANGLLLLHASDVITTRHCAFAGTVDDVNTLAGSTWIYCDDDFDKNNCTVAGIAQPADGQPVILFDYTVTVTGDFATIQDAIDWFKGRTIAADCIIDVDAGSYAENVVFGDIYLAATGSLKLEGDTRVLAGLTYMDSSATADALMNRAGLANGGSGICTLSTNIARDEITVAGSVANPDFNADGWGANDDILVYADDGNTYERIISSISPGGAGNHVIGITVALPGGATLGNDATAICLLPNRTIAPVASTACQVRGTQGLEIDGFFMDGSDGATRGLQSDDGAIVLCENVVAWDVQYGFFSTGRFSTCEATDGASSAWGCSIVGFYAANCGYLRSWRATANDCLIGFNSATLSFLYARYAIAINCTSRGCYGVGMAHIDTDYTAARQCLTGYQVNNGSHMRAYNTNAYNNGNGANYNPALSGVFGNNGAMLLWS